VGVVEQSALAYVAPPSNGVGRPVLIIHSWWGLTSSFTEIADELSGRGFLAGCVDLYQGAVATTEAEAQRLRQLKRSEPVYRVLQRCLRRLASDERAVSSAPAVLGFSMGAHWAVWLAQHPDPPISAAVLFYGARGGDFSLATAPVLAHFANVDQFVSRSARRSMERAIARRGLGYTAFDYPGTGHWFAEADHPAFDRTAAELAIDRSVAFITGLDPS
jgi:carboxymethylenebutenolidase